MFSKTLALSTVALAATSASALSLGVPCLTAFAGLATGNTSTCLNVLGMPALFTANGSIAGPLNTFLSGWCPAAPCTNGSLATSINSLESGCSTELGSLGFSISNTTSATQLNSYFDEIKSVGCLQSSNTTGYNSSYCVTETLYNLQALTGFQFTLPSVLSIVGGNYTGLMQAILPAATASPANLTRTLCTDCVKGIYTELTAYSSSINSTTVPTNTTSSGVSLGALLGSLCGANFVNGTIPTSVHNTTVNATLASIAAHSATGAAGASATTKSSSGNRVAGASAFVALVAGAVAVIAL